MSKTTQDAPSRRALGDTRFALLRAAEKLFAERGVDTVSLREVSVAAGQANNSAVAYHFGSREGLVDAILERHSAPIQARYEAQLDLLERRGTVDLRSIMEILALPIVAKLDDEDGGWEYLSLAAQLSVSPSLPLAARPIARTGVVRKLMAAIRPFAPGPADLSLFRLERLMSTIYVSTISWRRLEREELVSVPRAVFEQDLVDALVSIVSSPASEQTLAALEQAEPSKKSAPPRPKGKSA